MIYLNKMAMQRVVTEHIQGFMVWHSRSLSVYVYSALLFYPFTIKSWTKQFLFLFINYHTLINKK